jgi:hypothetical protein
MAATAPLLLLLLLAAFATPSGAADVPPGRVAAPSDALGYLVYDETGGDDVVVMTAQQIDTQSGPSLDYSQSGDFYLAIGVVDPTTGHEIRVYRSTDKGRSWTQWGRLWDPDPTVGFDEPCLHVAEGTQDRIYLACKYTSGAGDHTAIVVARSLLGVGAIWASYTALSAVGVDFSHPSLHSNRDFASGYTLFLAAQRADASGSDVLFTRSTDFGVNWETPYEIGNSTGSSYDYQRPFLRYGPGGIVHVAWAYEPRTPSANDAAIRYRRATSYAAGGIGDWGSIVALSSATNGVNERLPTLAPSHLGGPLVLSYARVIGTSFQPASVMCSTDDGASWTGGSTTFDHDIWVTAMSREDGGFSFMTSADFENYGVRNSSYGAPVTLSEHLSLMDYDHGEGNLPAPSNQAMSYPGQGRVAMTWTVENLGGGLDTLFFDAEWRRDPGYPNLERGFPLALPYDVVSPPAVCELDGDPQSELVFGDLHGYVRAYNHDGTVVSGWPQDADSLVRDETIAVGDLQMDGLEEVVVGSATGKVFVFGPHGALLPGWPLDLGTGLPAYVSIGPILGDGLRQIVAGSGNKLHLLRYDAGEAVGFPKTMGSAINSAAAVGDLDGNGTKEIVVVQTVGMDAFRHDGSVQSYRLPAGNTFVRSPTLGDLNQDGDLEITMCSVDGDVYVLNPDGTDYPGWPITMTSGNPGSSVTLAQIWPAVASPQLIWTEISPTQSKVHAFYENGTTVSGFPALTGADWYVFAEPIVDVLWKSKSSNVAVGSRDMNGYAWTNYGTNLFEWPKGLSGRCEVSPASGDFDQDGHVELAFCTVSPPKLVIVDQGADFFRNASDGRGDWWWPMYQYNAQRHGCLDCGLDRVLGVPGGTPRIARVSFAAPRPNPGSRATLAFELPLPAAVQLRVCDVAGREVRRLVKTELGAGEHRYAWDGRDDQGQRLPAGVYYAALRVSAAPGAETLTRKLVLVR